MKLATSDWYFEDFTLADRVTTMARTITEADLVSFVGFAGFFEEVFLSAPNATQEHFFGRRLVPGPMTFVLAEGLYILTGRSRHGIAYLGVEELRMTAPVACGDTIKCDVEIIEARAAKTGNRGIVRTLHSVRNQQGLEVLTYRSARMIQARPAGGESRPASASEVRNEP
jgi:acyl dehydratase